MTDSVGLVFVELLRLVLVAFVAAYFTNRLSAHFTFKRFQQEEQWKQTRDAYDSIIMELGRLRFNAGQELESLETQGTFGGASLKMSAQQRFTIQEIAAAGDYFVSARTGEAIRKVMGSMDGAYDDPHSAAEGLYDAADKALPIVREEAAKDLGTRRP